MSCEEKARELAHDYFRRGQLGQVSPDSESAGYECAMQMAEWKDEQMKKLRNCANCKYSMCAGDKSFCDDGVNTHLTDYWECCDNWERRTEK